MEFGQYNPEAEKQAEFSQLAQLMHEKLLPHPDVEEGDIDKMVDDAQGDPGDLRTMFDGFLLFLGEDPDEVLVEWGVLEPEAETE